MNSCFSLLKKKTAVRHKDQVVDSRYENYHGTPAVKKTYLPKIDWPISDCYFLLFKGCRGRRQFYSERIPKKKWGWLSLNQKITCKGETIQTSREPTSKWMTFLIYCTWYNFWLLDKYEIMDAMSTRAQLPRGCGSDSGNPGFSGDMNQQGWWGGASRNP